MIVATFSAPQNRKNRRSEERGAILIMTSLVMLLLLFIAAFATDLGAWYRQGQAQQQAADVSALNGVQAYNRGATDWLLSQGVATWDDPAIADLMLREDGELVAMTQAVNTILGLLETSGLSFNNAVPIEDFLTPQPNTADPSGDPTVVSQFTVTADDGNTVVTITRSVRLQNGMTVSSIGVSIAADGEQFLTSLLRDAPQIARTGDAALSNCGATCNDQFQIAPPFAGFNASGEGDGFNPLPFNKDGVSFNGFEEFWAINHHVSHGGGTTSEGRIICMIAATQEPCLGFNGADGIHFDLGTIYPTLQTPNRAEQFINSETGIILFTARDSAQNMSGIACWDAAARDWCGTRFVPLFNATRDNSSRRANWVNITGPYVNGTDAYAIAQDGSFACASLNADSSLDGTRCGADDTAAADHPNIPGINNRNFYISHAEIVGDRLITRYGTTNNRNVVACVNLTDNTQPCSGFAGRVELSVPYAADGTITFQARADDGSVLGVCALRTRNTGDDNHDCVDHTDGSTFTLGTNTANGTTFDAMVRSMSNSWAGDAFYFGTNGLNRTFFAGGNSNRVGCWDWSNDDNCGGTLTTDTAFTGSTTNTISPYGFAAASNGCVIGLSHRSVFFTFNPANLQACVDTRVETELTPCICQDGSTRWGEVQVPSSLTALVSRAQATLRDPVTGTVYVDGTTPAGDVLANNGLIDLSHVPNSVDRLSLILEVDTIIDPLTNDPAWQSPLDVDIALTIQPTLLN